MDKEFFKNVSYMHCDLHFWQKQMEVEFFYWDVTYIGKRIPIWKTDKLA